MGNRRVQVYTEDTGGPIFMKILVGNERKNVQIGVTSAMGDRNCKDGYSEFLSIKDHVSWIEEKMFRNPHQPLVFKD